MHSFATVLSAGALLVVAATVVVAAIAGTLFARSAHHTLGLPTALAGYLGAAVVVWVLAVPVAAAAIDVPLAYVAFCHSLVLVHLHRESAIADPERAAIDRARRILTGR